MLAHTFTQRSLFTQRISTSMRPIRLVGLAVRSAAGEKKGFGTTTNKKSTSNDDIPVEGVGAKTKRSRSKGKQSMRPGQGLAPVGVPLSGVSSATDALPESLTDQLEFEERLEALKVEAARKKAETVSQSGSGGILDAIPSYDNPPPIGATLFGSRTADSNPIAEREYAAGGFGPSQIGIAAASLLLVVVFIVSSGGSDLGYAARRPSAQQPTEMSPELRKDLETQLAEVAKKVEADANDLEALEASAVLNARLGELATASAQLEKLTSAKPEDTDAFRLLAETYSVAGETGKAAAAYRKAWTASGQRSLEVLTGLAGALVEDGKYQAAIDEIKAAGASVSSSSSADKDFGDVELGLLLAKTLGQWRGHGPDALTQYDTLAEQHPEDFRIPLGKGLLLRQQGREGDAQRYFIQAKYLAPPASRPAVDALTATPQR